MVEVFFLGLGKVLIFIVWYFFCGLVIVFLRRVNNRGLEGDFEEY